MEEEDLNARSDAASERAHDEEHTPACAWGCSDEVAASSRAVGAGRNECQESLEIEAEASPEPEPMFLPLSDEEQDAVPRFFLPSLTRNGNFKKTLVLDLDQTLIDCALVTQSITGQPCDFVYEDAMGGRAKVWKRPGLNLFLEEVAKDFEVVLFTAAGRRHADAVLAHIDPDGRFIQHRLFQEHTSMDSEWAWVKDLSQLGRDLGSTLIIDDCEKAALRQPANWVGIKPFSQSSPFSSRDTALMDILSFLKEFVLPASDVRQAISSFYNNVTRRPKMSNSFASCNNEENHENPFVSVSGTLCRVAREMVSMVSMDNRGGPGVFNVFRHSLPASKPSSTNDAGILQGIGQLPEMKGLDC